MARVDHLEQCPRCAESGGDRRGDNLAVYVDGGVHCFACQYHRNPMGFRPVEKELSNGTKSVLPVDFEREVPSRAWQWLLQYGLSWKYWQPYVGWTEKDSRLIFTVGNTPSFSIGRTMEERTRAPKWKVYGDSHREAHVLGREGSCVVLVEDIISAHKVGETTQCIPLFGTNVFDGAIAALRHLKLPILMWLDKDQDLWAPRRAATLAMVTGLPVTYASTKEDPKCQTNLKITQIVKESCNVSQECHG